MPFVENQGAKIYWDERSMGEPVLLIMGLGYPSDMWWRTRPLLDSRYRTIVLDNRGAGRSGQPVHSIALMAADAVAVLDAAGVESAHVFGISMGGMIAQELALQWPLRVRSLILGCTAAGGPTAVRSEPEAAQVLIEPRIDATRGGRCRRDTVHLRSRHSARRRIRRRPGGSPAVVAAVEGYTAQLQGILAWEAYSRLPQVTASTLVIHAKQTGSKLVQELPMQVS